MRKKTRSRRSSQDLSNGLSTPSTDLLREEHAVMLSIAEDTLDIIPSGVACIPHILQHYNNLVILNLFDRQIKSQGFLQINKVLCISTSIIEISLRYNNLSHASADAIGRLLSSNNHILKLDLEDNELQDVGLIKIAQYVRYSRIPCIYFKHNSTQLECQSSRLLKRAVLDNKWIISTSYSNMSDAVLMIMETRAKRCKEAALEFMRCYREKSEYGDSLLNQLTSFQKPVSFIIWDQAPSQSRCSMITALEKLTYTRWREQWLYLSCICKSIEAQHSLLFYNKEVLSYIALFISANDITPESKSL